MKAISLFMVFLLSAALSVAQQKDTGALAKFVQQKTDEAFVKSKVPGILVFYRDKEKPGFYTTGFSDPVTKTRFDENTFFEIGSITKTFTAYIVMCVLRDKKIADSSFILSYLPDSVQKNTALAKIRFINLLNHTSGLPRMPDNMDVKDDDLQPYAAYDSKKLFAYLKTVQPSDKKEYEYSNLGAALAGVLAERITGKSYAALLDKYIFLPFKMLDKNNSIEKSVNKSQGYIDDTTKAEYWNMNVMAPAGGLKSNAREMNIYLQHMSLPATKADAVIMDSLTSPTHSLSPVMAIGRGWHCMALKKKPVIYWHNGGTYGFSTFAAFTRNTNQWVMVVVNHFDKNDTVSDRIGMQIMNRMTE
ncbi:MAG: serine hydrolase [Ferruginibacter sp.]